MARLEELLKRIRSLEADLAEELRLRREARGYHLDGRRVVIEAQIRRAHRAQRRRIPRYLWEARLLSYLAAPMIYLAILPALLLDLYVGLYQRLCFPVYGIPRVRRRDYLVMDRRHLPYLNAIEKLNCHYCSYFNGLMAYVQEVAGRTEQHWCPIKHARPLKATHSRYHRFFEYGDAEGYRDQVENLRRDFADLGAPHSPP